MQLDEFLTHLDGVKKTGPTQYMACCPVKSAHKHGDRAPSLSVGKGNNGSIVFYCQGGCSQESVLQALGLSMKDLFPDGDRPRVDRRQEHRPRPTIREDRGSIAAQYDYTDENGQLLARKTRWETAVGGKRKKTFTWGHPAGQGFQSGRNGMAVPYRLPELVKAETVFLCEGEKDVDNLTAQGLAATCTPDGAGTGSKWRDTYTPYFAGKTVYILQDNDEVGKKFAQYEAEKLSPVAQEVKVLDLTALWPGLPEHGDISDVMEHLGATQALADLLGLADKAPGWEPVEEPPQPPENGLSVISAVELQQKDIPPARFVVVDFLPQGLSLLASPPKYGKSWFVLDLCLSVAAGTPFLGRDTVQSGCLYLALEDSQRRLQDRMNKVLGGRTAPQGFYFATSALDIGEGLLEQLEGHMAAHPDTGLIVIDTLQKVRGAGNSRENAYSADYREVGALKAFADKHGVCLLLVHHLRKMADDGDPFNRISGTNGIMGAADSVFVLSRKKRSDTQTTLSVTGRDIESREMVLEFDKGSYRWQVLGSVEQMEEQQARTEYESNYIPGTIRELVEQSGGRWSGTMQDLLDAAKRYHGVLLADNTKALSNEVKRFERSLLEYDGILHDRVRNGNGGGKHRFYKRQPATTESQPQGEQLSI